MSRIHGPLTRMTRISLKTQKRLIIARYIGPRATENMPEIGRVSFSFVHKAILQSSPLRS